jgi:Uracil DNA glycosylase superfamily
MYKNEPPIPIDKLCANCKLSAGCTVSGRGPDNLAQVKLIVVSDYPGAYESEFGWPQVPNDWVETQRKNKRKLPGIPNSGKFIRDLLTNQFNLDTYTEVYFTNAFKCDPNFQGRTLKPTERHLGICASSWGSREFAILDSFCPTVPILTAGSWALKLISNLYRDQAPAGSIDNLLRQSDLKAGTHPLVCSYNPATYARSHGRIEVGVSVSRRSGLTEITSLQPLSNFVYSPENIYLADLERLREYLL